MRVIKRTRPESLWHHEAPMVKGVSEKRPYCTFATCLFYSISENLDHLFSQKWHIGPRKI